MVRNHQRRPAIPPAVALAGAAVAGSVVQGISGSKAAKAQVKAQEQSIAEQRRQYDTTRADFAPWRDTGVSALQTLGRAYGLNGQAADMTAFTESPGYQFRYNEGLRAIDRGAAARGLLHSGAAVKQEQRYGEGLAASEFGDWWNRLSGIAGTGQAATQSVSNAGQNATNNISQAYTNQGNARASSYINTGSAINSGINNVLGGYFQGGFGKGWGG